MTKKVVQLGRRKMKKVGLLLTFIMMICSISFTADIWMLNFESAGGYTPSITEFSDGATDYFATIKMNGDEDAYDYNHNYIADVDGISLSNIQGEYFFSGMDIDGEGALLPVNITVQDVSIYGYSNLNFYVYLAEDDNTTNQDWDESDYVHIDYDIDNSGSFTNLLWIESSGGTGTEPAIDTNFDGTGDGSAITDNFTEYSKGISTEGYPNFVDIRITFYLDSGEEDIAIDNLRITGDYTLPVTLSTFTAQYLNSKPTLYWQTQSEEDNMGWFIYRNTIEDFTSSEKISGMIEGHGTTTQPQSYIYEDAEELQVEQTYYYWLESVDYSGTIHHYDRVAQITIPHPDDPGQNVTPPVAYDISADPNPFAYSTEITFAIDQISRIDVTIYNVKGQMVKSFGTVMTSQENETVTFSWNGKSDASKSLSNGVYLYSVKVNGKDYATKQLILMK